MPDQTTMGESITFKFTNGSKPSFIPDGEEITIPWKGRSREILIGSKGWQENLSLEELRQAYKYLLSEKYRKTKRPSYTYLPFHYHHIPAFIRTAALEFLTKGVVPAFPRFPVDRSLEVLKELSRSCNLEEGDWAFPTMKVKWKDGKKFVILLSHDIDTFQGFGNVKKIFQLEKDLGMKGLWNVVGSWYPLDHNVLEYCVDEGGEIGLHGFNHDNKIAFLSEEKMRWRLEKCEELKKRYSMRGFRSPSYLRTDSLMGVLEKYFDYDSSIPDADHISPGGAGGSCSIFPYFINSLVEIPVTLPYEVPFFKGVPLSKINDFWKEKVEWVKEQGGVIMVNIHPDPHYTGGEELFREYAGFLKMLASEKDSWVATPNELVRWVRENETSFDHLSLE